jgi:hypothetical protein
MRECRLAGLLVTTNRPVAEQTDGRSVDGEVQVLFRPKLDPARFTNEWHRLDQTGSPPAYFRGDGKQVELEDIGASTADYGPELRRVVPFASALQGKIVLHGSAVRFGEWAVAFLGGSGAGKSTLEPMDISLKGSPSRGSADAKVTMVEFTDCQCPFCSRHKTNTSSQILKNYVDTGKLRYYLGQFPLGSIHPGRRGGITGSALRWRSGQVLGAS